MKRIFISIKNSFCHICRRAFTMVDNTSWKKRLSEILHLSKLGKQIDWAIWFFSKKNRSIDNISRTSWICSENQHAILMLQCAKLPDVPLLKSKRLSMLENWSRMRFTFRIFSFIVSLKVIHMKNASRWVVSVLIESIILNDLNRILRDEPSANEIRIRATPKRQVQTSRKKMMLLENELFDELL